MVEAWTDFSCLDNCRAMISWASVSAGPSENGSLTLVAKEAVFNPEPQRAARSRIFLAATALFGWTAVGIALLRV
jgi:hypothetical protein